MANQLFQNLTNQIQNQVLQDNQGGINPIAREYVIKNYQVRTFSFDEPIPSEIVDSDYDPKLDAVVSKQTNYFFTADCGCRCTLEPTENRTLPFLTGITFNGQTACSRCFRRCSICNNFFMVSEGKHVHADFTCNKHLFIKHLRWLTFHLSRIFLEYEDKPNFYQQKGSNKNAKLQP